LLLLLWLLLLLLLWLLLLLLLLQVLGRATATLQARMAAKASSQVGMLQQHADL
jgi:NADH:ubiquinone oxidoreductase subunit H